MHHRVLRAVSLHRWRHTLHRMFGHIPVPPASTQHDDDQKPYRAVVQATGAVATHAPVRSDTQPALDDVDEALRALYGVQMRRGCVGDQDID
jgi:hypothetical protein